MTHKSDPPGALGSNEGLGGWQLVPVEPTPEMVLAAWGTPCEDADPTDPGTIAAWSRMLAAAPPPAEREPLTDEQIEALFKGVDSDDKGRFAIVRGFARAIEAAHGIEPLNAKLTGEAGGNT